MQIFQRLEAPFSKISRTRENRALRQAFSAKVIISNYEFIRRKGISTFHLKLLDFVISDQWSWETWNVNSTYSFSHFHEFIKDGASCTLQFPKYDCKIKSRGIHDPTKKSSRKSLYPFPGAGNACWPAYLLTYFQLSHTYMQGCLRLSPSSDGFINLASMPVLWPLDILSAFARSVSVGH